MKIYKPGLPWYVNQLRKNEPFSFIRYGNGEWDCVLGTFHKTRSGSQQFSRELRSALTSVLEAPLPDRCYMALQSTDYLKRIRMLPGIEAWLREHKVEFNWHDGEVFHKASKKARLFQLSRELKQRRTVVVGPRWLLSLPFSGTFIPVRRRNCWQDVDSLYKKLSTFRNAVISFSAGPTTKVLIRRLFPVIGDTCWLLDFGSLWDPYCGVESRRYHKSMSKAKCHKNLYGK